MIADAAVTIPAETWHLIGVEYAYEEHARIYVDGVDVTRESHPEVEITGSSADLAIGSAAGAAASSPFDGRIASVSGGAGIFGMKWTTEVYACSWHSGGELARLSFMRYDEAVATYPSLAQYPDAGRTVIIWTVIDSTRTFEPRPCPTIRAFLQSASP